MSDAPAPEPAPATPAPEAAATPKPARPEWTPPDTFADKFSRASTKAVQYSIAAFGLLSTVLFVLWLVPAVVVARSDAYATAKACVAGDARIKAEVGTPITCAAIPSKYLIGTSKGDLFRFEFEGATLQGEADVRVHDGQADIVRFYFGAKF